MKLESLTDLFITELKDLYSAEKQLVKALPKMAKAATSKDLKNGFEHHLQQTKRHVERLEKVFSGLDASPRGKKCVAMEALIKEGEDLTKKDAEPEVLDAGLIAAAQKVEHYEIAGYGCVRTYAELLGDNKAASLLQTTLDEEGETDKTLTELAEQLNVEAEDEEERSRSASNGRSRSIGRRIRTAVGL
jgi:ferritin-like metal-binding protein YciE